MVGVVDKRKLRQKSKVVELGLEKRLFEEMKKPKFTIRGFMRDLHNEGYDINELSVRRFISKSKDLQKEYIKSDLKEASNFKNIVVDYKTTITEIIEEIKEVRKTCLDEKEYQAYSNMVGRLFQGLELLAKITGDLNKASNVDIKIIYQEINKQLNTNAKKHKKEIFGDVIDVDAYVQEQDDKISQELRGEQEKND